LSAIFVPSRIWPEEVNDDDHGGAYNADIITGVTGRGQHQHQGSTGVRRRPRRVRWRPSSPSLAFILEERRQAALDSLQRSGRAANEGSGEEEEGVTTAEAEEEGEGGSAGRGEKGRGPGHEGPGYEAKSYSDRLSNAVSAFIASSSAPRPS
jgi:hypothetical protein